jgi:hypothetical protein
MRLIQKGPSPERSFRSRLRLSDVILGDDAHEYVGVENDHLDRNKRSTALSIALVPTTGPS